MTVLDLCAQRDAPLTVRFACLAMSAAEGDLNVLRKVCERLRVPTDCRALAEVVAREHHAVHRSAGFDAAALVRLLESCDALRRPERWDEILLACECDARGRSGLQNVTYPQRARLNSVRLWASEIDSAAVAQKAASRGLKGAAIGDAVHASRVAAVQSRMQGHGPSEAD